VPWVREENGTENFAALRKIDWQAQVYGEPTNDLEQACAQLELRLQRYPWSEAASKSGLGRGALYLVRPDGHAGPAVVPTALRNYQARLGLSFA
jgi:hypothetical protein